MTLYMLSKEKFLQQLPENIFIEGRFMDNEVFVDYKALDLQKSLKVRNHSPTGFNWGYLGSGPAQFALALLMEFTDSETAQYYYQDLKSGWIGRLPQSDFMMHVHLRIIMQEIIAKSAASGPNSFKQDTI